MKLHQPARSLSIALSAVMLTGIALVVLDSQPNARQSANMARLAHSAPVASLSAPAAGTARAPDPATQARLNESYGKLPLSFEANQGQSDAQVKFLSRGQGYGLFLTSNEAVLSLTGKDQPAAVVRMSLLGSNAQPAVSGAEPLPGKSNYLIGNDRQQWHTDVAQYAKVKYRNVYPGVDMVYYGNQRQLEYDLVVAPGADPKAIQLGFSGVDNLRLDKDGNLLLHTAQGDLVQHKPVVYQTIEGSKVAVDGHYTIHAEPVSQQTTHSHQVGFQIASYDTSQPLVIDPLLVYSASFGGNSTDKPTRSVGIAIDSSGNAYVTGMTVASDFPVVNAFQSALMVSQFSNPDAFVSKLNATGTALLYSTYLGGRDFDEATGIAVDSSGSAYVTGRTNSSDFPTLHPAQGKVPNSNTNAFITKLNADGNALVYSTYLGGSVIDTPYAISVDSSNNAYVTGSTISPDFPRVNALDNTYNGSSDAFITKLNAAGNAFVYSTYLGSTAYDSGTAIAVDGSGNAYVTGSTLSRDFPLANPFSTFNSTNGSGDAFVIKLAATGNALLYSTFLGGNNTDAGTGIAVDGSGNAYVTGYTSSNNFPVTPGAPQSVSGGGFDDFVTKLSASGSALLYSTYLGGSANELSGGIAVDGSGNAYASGTTASANFPVKASLQVKAPGGDAVVTGINAGGTALIYSTYLGGNGGDGSTGIAADSTGNVYVTGSTTSANFPATPGALRTTDLATSNVFISKISLAGAGNGVLQFSAPAYSVRESGLTATISVTRATGVTGAVSVDYATGNGTAVSLADYTASSGTLQWAAGDGAAKTFSVPITNDTVGEPNKTVILSLSNPGGGASLATPNPATLVILDDDESVQFAMGNSVVDEAAGNVTISVVRFGNATTSATVNYATADGSALAGADYTAVSGQLTFSGSIRTRTITVPVLNDTLVEDAETFSLVLSQPGNTVLQQPDIARIVINDDEPSQFRLATPTYAIAEGATQVTVAVFRMGDIRAPASVDYTTGDVNARAGVDYTAVAGTLRFAPGQRAMTFQIGIIDDALVEPNEVLNVVLTNPAGAVLVTPFAATVIIRDNEASQLSFSSAVYSVTEGTPSVTISVYRLGNALSTASVSYGSFDGTATGADYIPVTGSLVFGAGQNLRTFTIPIYNDALAEPDETVNLALFSPNGATLVAPVWATLTIVSDD